RSLRFIQEEPFRCTKLLSQEFSYTFMNLACNDGWKHVQKSNLYPRKDVPETIATRRATRNFAERFDLGRGYQQRGASIQDSDRRRTTGSEHGRAGGVSMPQLGHVCCVAPARQKISCRTGFTL